MKHDSATVLDLGCCFGQDLRRLAADGAPSENMYASDLRPELWELGYDLFRDRERMKARFIEADILDPITPLRELKGKIDIILTCQLLHLFSLKDQLEALKKIVKMSRLGTCVVGYQGGAVQPTELQMPWAVMFYHNVDSFNELWRMVERETGTRWVVDAWLVSPSQWGWEKEDYDWAPSDRRGLNFIVTRSDG